MEQILCAAIWFDDGIKHYHQTNHLQSGFIMCGYRHCCIFEQMGIIQPDYKGKYKIVQGFLTNTNRFVDRVEGAAVAFKAKQTKRELTQLFSEDLY
jgi:hypothetical protein